MSNNNADREVILSISHVDISFDVGGKKMESFEECMETSASKAPLKHLVPLMALFMLQLGLAVSSVVRLFVRHYVPTLRKSDSWGLLPFSLAPPCFA